MIRRITRSPVFVRQIRHLDPFLRKKLNVQIRKILNSPEIGRPLKYTRGERALYLKPFRIVYAVQGDELVLLKFDHRKRVYRR